MENKSINGIIKDYCRSEISRESAWVNPDASKERRAKVLEGRIENITLRSKLSVTQIIELEREAGLKPNKYLENIDAACDNIANICVLNKLYSRLLSVKDVLTIWHTWQKYDESELEKFHKFEPNGDGCPFIVSVGLSYRDLMNDVMKNLNKNKFVDIDGYAKRELLRLGIPLVDGEYCMDATDYTCILNLINNYPNNLVIQHCVFLMLKKMYLQERAENEYINNFIMRI